MDLDQVKEKLYSLKKEVCFLVDNKNIVDVEQNIELILGYKKEEIIGKCYKDIICIDENIKNLDGIINLKNKKGEEVLAKIDYDTVGDGECIVGTIREISIQEKIQHQYKTIEDIILNSRDIVYFYEEYPVRKFRFISKSIYDVLGYTQEQVYNNSEKIFTMVHIEDEEKLNKKVKGELDFKKPIVNRWKDSKGNYVWIEDYAVPMYDKDGNFFGVSGICRDVSESIKLEEELRYLTYHDVVTGLYNRNYYENIFKKFNELKDENVGVILCDLDELKYVNDNFGHHRGDELIESFGKFLNDFCNKNRIAFRIGGDEILIMEIGGTEESLENLIKDIKLNIKKINTERKNILLKFSLGSAYTTNSFNNMNTLVKLADLRMYRNKNTKKSMKP